MSELVPTVGAAQALRVPPFVDRLLGNGLRVVAVHRPAVPRIEMRLRIPAGLAHDSADGSRARLLPETLLGGTKRRSSVEVAAELQRLGAALGVRVDQDDLVIAGGTLAGTAPQFFSLLAEVLTMATFPEHEVAVARVRVAQEIEIARSQPQTLATEAMDRRLYGRHRYGRGLPDPDAVRGLMRADVTRYHRTHVLPAGSTCVLVGDLQPKRIVEVVEQALEPWERARTPAPPMAPPEPRAGLPTLLVDRPGSVQTSLRVGGPAIPRSHTDFFKLALANLIFGGYFTSRLVKNIRESKGYTYSPQSLLVHRRGGSAFVVSADVGTEVTAAALAEVRYELARMVTTTPTHNELEAVRRYFAGLTALQIQTQAGLAAVLDSLLVSGLDLGYLRAFRSQIERVTVADIRDASARYLAPARLLTVLVGDRAVVGADLEALEPVEISSGG